MSRTVYKAVIYTEMDDGKGNLTFKRVTTSRWVTVPQIAASVGVAPQTMYRSIVDDGIMPFYRINSQIRVRAEDFAAWLENCRNAEYERPGVK
jgi:excisionase family DNA binding protein